MIVYNIINFFVPLTTPFSIAMIAVDVTEYPGVSPDPDYRRDGG